MKRLAQNIIGIFGKKGELWLAELPNIVKVLSEQWNLTHVVPIENMSFNYVAKAIHQANQPVVLKIGCETQLITDEKKALEYFDGGGSIRLMDASEEYKALLLQQAVPGLSLKSLYPMQIEFVIDCYATTAQKLYDKPLRAEDNDRHLSDWLRSIDNLKPDQLPKHLLKKAIHLKNELLSSSTQQVFLHGDLHLDNILKNGSDWLAIDPKGIVGEPEFDIAAFDFIHPCELERKLPIKALFEARVERLSHQMNLNAQRVKNWAFVRLILAAAWWIEDHGDPSHAIKLAESLI